MRPLPTLLLVALAVLSTGCANMSQTRTGFLDDYESLERAKDREVWGVPDEILLHRTAALDEALANGGIRAVVVDPVVYRPVADARYTMSDESAAKLESWSTEKFQAILAEDFEVLDEPAPGAARVRLAVTDVNPANVWVNIIGVILVVPPDMGGVSGELELVDAMTGERLAAMTATREGTPFLVLECFSPQRIFPRRPSRIFRDPAFRSTPCLP